MVLNLHRLEKPSLQLSIMGYLHRRARNTLAITAHTKQLVSKCVQSDYFWEADNRLKPVFIQCFQCGWNFYLPAHS